MDNFITAILTFNLGSHRSEDDRSARLNHVWMSGLLLLMASFCGMKQYYGRPLDCWAPAQYDEDFQTEYINSLCFVSQLYVHDMDTPIPRIQDGGRYKNDVTFYRWTVVFFLVQAFMFHLPRHLWNHTRKAAGSNLDGIVNMSSNYSSDKMELIAGQVIKWTRMRNKGRGTQVDEEGQNKSKTFSRDLSTWLIGKRSGRQLVTVYLLTKLLYLINSIAQGFLVSSFLKLDIYKQAMSAVGAVLSNEDFEDLDNFPRVSYCDLLIRQQTNVITYTVQCVLSLNIFLDKMFLISWFCIMFVNVVNAFSLGVWTFRVVKDNTTTRFVEHLLKGKMTARERSLWERVRQDLQPDGLFMLRMVSRNSSDLVASDLVRHLMAHYDKDHESDSDKIST